MEKIINVAIVEDIKDIRESLQTLINSVPGFNSIGMYATAEAAIADIPSIIPDVVLMDINLPGLSGVDAVRLLKINFPEINFLMCTVFEDTDNIFRALEAGAGGYILKNNSPSKLLEAIREVQEGGAPMSAAIAKKVINSFHKIPKENNSAHRLLSDREIEVLQLLSQGMLYKEAANKLDLSTETIRSHCRNIYEKLHVNTRIEAINMVFGKK
jgi:DNA-binding NarL/FixJ family response regulator